MCVCECVRVERMMRAYSHAHSNTRAQVENSDHTRRVKTGFCRLVCLVMSKRHLVTFKQEMRFRNKILDRIVSFVSTGTAGLSPHTSCCLCVCVCVSLSLSLSVPLCMHTHPLAMPITTCVSPPPFSLSRFCPCRPRVDGGAGPRHCSGASDGGAAARPPAATAR